MLTVAKWFILVDVSLLLHAAGRSVDMNTAGCEIITRTKLQ